MDLKLSRELIEIIDLNIPSPEKCAEKVLEVLRKSELSDYEVLCFCVQFLAGRAMVDLNFMIGEIQTINRLFYVAHYQRAWQEIHQPETSATGTIQSDTTSIGEASETSSESSPPKD